MEVIVVRVETLVTGPENRMLRMDERKPCWVEVMVKLDAGRVIVVGMVVVMTPEEVRVVPLEVKTLTTETGPVNMLTTVAAGDEVTMVTTLGFEDVVFTPL